MPGSSYSSRSRRGFSFLELQVAFALLGIGLAGLGPLVVMLSRQVQHYEDRLDPAATHYFVPSSDPWARRLGVPATLQTDAPVDPLPPSATLVDDGSAAFTRSAEAVPTAQYADHPPAVGGVVCLLMNTPQNASVSWGFFNQIPGWYEVWITHPALTSQDSQATYHVLDGTTVESTVLVDQYIACTESSYAGVGWKKLGTFSIESGTLVVQLDGLATGTLAADAVRIVPVRNTVDILSFTESNGGESVTAQVRVTGGSG